MDGWGSNLNCSCEILWMEEILHQLIDGLFKFLSGFNHPVGGAGFRNHPQYQRRQGFLLRMAATGV